MVHHRGIRCAGFSVGPVAYCTREEYAGRAALDITTEPPSFRHSIAGRCVCGNEHGYAAVAPATFSKPRLDDRLELNQRNEVFTAALGLMTLRPEALADLFRRGLTRNDVDHVGFRSLPRKGKDLENLLATLVNRFGESYLRRCPGFTDKNGRTSFRTASVQDGYVVPYRDSNGAILGLQFKFLGGRYETARGSRVAEMHHIAGTPVPGHDIYVTEGGLKAEVAHSLGGMTVMGLPGQSLAESHVSVLRSLHPSRVVVALDQEPNEGTSRAREKWLRSLFSAGLDTYEAVWEGTAVGGMKGLDDLLLAGGRPRLRARCFAPPGIGERRVIRPSDGKGEVRQGISLASARHDTRDAILEFVRGGPKR